MTVLIGGNFASGGLRNWGYQSAIAGLNERLQLVTPVGYDTLFAATTSQRDYADFSSQRSELSAPNTLALWGKVFTAVWRVILPPNWATYAGEAECTVLQMHDVNVASVARGPSFFGSVQNNLLMLKLCHDDAPSGDIVASMPILPGQEVAVGLNVRWADGTNEPLVNGFVNVYFNGALAGSRTGRNTWATVDPNPPYQKVGAYVPSTAPWWAGKSRTVWHRGAALGDANEPLDFMDSLIRVQTVAAFDQTQPF